MKTNEDIKEPVSLERMLYYLVKNNDMECLENKLILIEAELHIIEAAIKLKEHEKTNSQELT